DDAAAGSIVVNAFLVARGRLKLARGELRSGVDDLLELGRRSEHDGVSATIGAPTFRSYAAPALAALGDADAARGLADEELALARAWGAPRAVGTALRVAGVVAGELSELEEAVDVLGATRARLEHARALADLGAARRRAGMASEAREPLRAAAALAAACGAAPLLAFAREELDATGARRTDRTLLQGVDALTPSERRVARMAADGLTNREIAQALFLTRKTIEMHLGRVYRKLDIGSRAELGDALTPAVRTPRRGSRASRR
ncbi:MAG TPA: helix-turn-helix transcriptional regulator, partial [Solirubrobacteraceae bacterium]